MQKNTTGQKLIVFAFDRTDNTPVTGDAANITANLRKDNGSAVATNDTNPTETEDGFYAFDLTQAETNADVMQAFPASVTADVQVIAVPGVIYTTPASFGDDVIQTADHTAAIADVPNNSEFNARTIASATYATAANLATVDSNVDAILVDTNDLQTNQGDWLTATGFATTAEIADVPTVAEFNARTLPNADYFIVTDYTAPDNAGITQTQADIAALNDISVVDILTTQMTESYAADGVAPTLAQGIFNIQQNLGDFAYAGTTKTTKRIDGSTTAATYTLDDATNPTSSTRAS